MKGHESGRRVAVAARGATFALGATLFVTACIGPPAGAPTSEPTARRADHYTIEVIGNSWRPLGPAAIHGGQLLSAWAENPTSARGTVTGRVSAIAYNPQNPVGDVWVGAGTGGLWRGTLQPTLRWSPVGDELETLAIGVIRVDPASCNATRCNTVWVGTGESAIRRDTQWGVGVYRGDWNATQARYVWTGPLGGQHFRRGSITGMVLDPDTAPGGTKRIFVALSSGMTANATHSAVPTTPPGGYGIWRSSDNGASWTRVLDTSGPATDLEIDPAVPDTLYAGVRGAGFFRSTANGAAGSWTAMNTGIPSAAVSSSDWAELAVQHSSPTASAVLYAVLGDCPSPFHKFETACSPAVYRSGNGGASWSQVFAAITPPDLDYTRPLHSYVSYTHALVVHPTDPSRVWYGGTGLYRSTDSAQSWTSIGLSMHPDQHVLLPVLHEDISGGMALYAGNDGGFYVAGGEDGFSDIFQRGLETVQFQSISVRNGVLIGGTQDNGTVRYDGSEIWEHINDGDAASTVLDADTPGRAYDVYYGARPRYTNDVHGAHNWSSADPDDVTMGPVAWYPPLAQDPTPLASGQHPLYFGTERLWRSVASGVPAWTAVSLPPALSAGEPAFYPEINEPTVVSAIAVAPSNPNRIYLGYYGGQVYTTANGLVASPTWTRVDTATLPNRPVTAIAVHPTDAARVFVAFSGFGTASVYRSSTAGASWSAHSASDDPDPANGFATEPVNALAIESAAPHRMWAGTDRGVYLRDSADTDGGFWSRSTAGLPNVAVYAFAIDEDEAVIYAATHGRGVWALSTNPIARIYAEVCCGCIDLYCPAPYVDIWASQFDAGQSCTMALFDDRGTACGAPSAVDADGARIHTDARGVLVATRSGAYSARPMAYACAGGTCAGGISAARCNVASVRLTCGRRSVTRAVTRPAMRRDPPSTRLALTPRLATGATGGSFELRALLRRTDGPTQVLCSTRVSVARGDTAERVIESAAAAVNASDPCRRAGVTAVATGTRVVPRDREDEIGGDPRLQLVGAGLVGVQLVTAVVAAGNVVAASVDGVGAAEQTARVTPRLALSGLPMGGVLRVAERTPLGVCTVQVESRRGERAEDVAARVHAAFLAPPAAPPRVFTGVPDPCPAGSNARDASLAGAAVSFPTGREVRVESTDPGLSYLVGTE